MRRGWYLLVLLGALTLVVAPNAVASIAHPQNASEAQQAAQSTPPPSAGELKKLLAEDPSQLTDAQRAQLGAALLNAKQTTTVTSSTAPPATPGVSSSAALAAAAYGNCFGAVESTVNWSGAGVNIGSVSVGVNGWCAGPGNQAIVAVFGWFFPSWAWGPYCINNDIETHGPDYALGSLGPNTLMAHGLHSGHLGVSYPWGCGGLNPGEDALRIYWWGGADSVNDWGF